MVSKPPSEHDGSLFNALEYAPIQYEEFDARLIRPQQNFDIKSIPKKLEGIRIQYNEKFLKDWPFGQRHGILECEHKSQKDLMYVRWDDDPDTLSKCWRFNLIIDEVKKWVSTDIL